MLLGFLASSEGRLKLTYTRWFGCAFFRFFPPAFTFYYTFRHITLVMHEKQNVWETKNPNNLTTNLTYFESRLLHDNPNIFSTGWCCVDFSIMKSFTDIFYDFEMVFKPLLCPVSWLVTVIRTARHTHRNRISRFAMCSIKCARVYYEWLTRLLFVC